MMKGNEPMKNHLHGYRLPDLVPPDPVYQTCVRAAEKLRAACAARADFATYYELGESEDGRPIAGVVLGHGPQTASLIAGNHADEPVGPETLRTFILEGIRAPDEAGLNDLFERFRFVIVPHTNPDGEARNRPWIEAWPDVPAYLRHRVREKPGRDLEFGFPDLRRENRLVADFLRAHGPFALHMSLHGMGFSEGAQLLIDRHWTFRTQPLRDAFAEAADAAGLSMHDHTRKGEKGFFSFEPGFPTTPEGAAMRTFFHAQSDEATAVCFRDSSMEFVRALGGDPLCLVTELPLFVVEADAPSPPGVPEAYLALKAARARGESVDALQEHFGLRPLPLCTAMRLQLQALALGLEAVA